MRYALKVALVILALEAASCARRGGAGAPAGTGAPPAPDSLTASPLGCRGASIGWRDRSNGDAWFLVERRGPSSRGWSRVRLAPPGETRCTDWGLEADSPYGYRVTSVGADGSMSSPTNPAEMLTLPTSVPEPRVEVFDRRAVSPGATLFGLFDPDLPLSLALVMAVDEEGRVVWQFEFDAFLVTETDVLPGGDILLQSGFTTIRVSRQGMPRSWTSAVYVHHDVDALPWGNLVAISSPSLGPGVAPWTVSGVPGPGAKRTLERIIEVDPGTERVVNAIEWERLVPADHDCGPCLGTWLFDGSDWLHLNSVEYDLADEALYVSVRNLNRVYKIGYPDGEIEWILGDGGDFGEGLFSHQHNPGIVAPGRMLMFDNGLHRGFTEPSWSRVIEIEFDGEAGAARIVWEYDGPPPFRSEIMGDATRLENGNTLIVDSADRWILEVSPDGMPVWELTVPPPYVVYKAHRVPGFP